MIDDVRKFMLAAEQTTDEFNVRQTALYIGLQLEEMAEKLEAIFYYSVHPVAVRMKDMSMMFKEGHFDHHISDSSDYLKGDMLDADIDLMWVTIGSVLSQGADIHGAMAEVNRSNMSKLVDGRMVKDGNGKVTKPDHYSPPDLTPFVK